MIKKRIILLTQGGAGDVLAQTPMIRSMRKKYPEDEILVTCTYSQLLEHNPNVDILVPLKEPKDFYDEYVLRSPNPIRFFKKRFLYDYCLEADGVEWLGASCLPEFACTCYGVPYDGGSLDFFPTDYELKAMKTFTDQSIKMGRPLVLLHIYTAVPSDGMPTKTNHLKDINPKIIEPIVAKYKDKIDFLQIGLIGEPRIEGSLDGLGMPMRDVITCMKYATTGILAESLFAHGANSMNMPAIVIHQSTNPKFFGHPTAHNLSYSGGCPHHPCNRPVGALVDLAPGYTNPKIRNQLLWDCDNQVCATMPSEEIEKVLLEIINKKVASQQLPTGTTSLEEARNS
jgi:ADP-heptose:LPS heptosyltransferase